MKRKLFFLFPVAVLFALSCKKDKGTPNPPPAADPYMTTTANSTWQYKLENYRTTTTTEYTVKATSGDSSINGRTYRIYERMDNGSHEYYNISGSDYYGFRDLGDNFGGTKLDILYLKDNLAVNDTWEQSFNVTLSGFTIPVKLTNTVKEKGSTRTVNGVAYSDVIFVETIISSSLIPASGLTSDIKSYYAPKVGNIETIYKIHLDYLGFTNDVDTKLTLLSSDLK